MITLGQFENQWYGKDAPNNHGNFVGECVSLAAQWAQNGLGVPNADAVLYCSHTGGARDLYEQFDGQLPTYFERLPYGNAPQDGDLVVWGANMGIYGDVAIYIGSGQVFGQLGTPVFLPAAPRQMTPQPLGYLRLKGTPQVIDQDLLQRMYEAWLGRDPQPQDESWIGKNPKDLAIVLDGSKERVQYLANHPLVSAGFVPYSGPQLFTEKS